MASNTYTVKAGDTLSGIGRKTGVAWTTIAKLNNIKSPYVIHPGQILKLSADVTPTPNPTPTPTPDPGSGFSTAAPMRKRLWGTYAQSPGKGGTLWELQSLTELENKLNYKFPIVSGFTDDNSTTGNVGDSVPFDVMKTVANQGRTTIQSFDLDYNFSNVLSGKYDNKLKAFAAACKANPGPVYLRLWAEMNGNWATWSVGSSESNVTSVSQWIDAWKHIVGIFRDAGATNTKFVWCPNNEDVGKYKMEQYWPGSDWVDVLGFDGYNWGGSGWQTHKEVFQGVYGRLTALDSKLPIWIGEMGSAEGSTGQKATWITNLLNETGFTRIQALCWFSVNKEKAWQMDSSPESLQAFKEGFSN